MLELGGIEIPPLEGSLQEQLARRDASAVYSLNPAMDADIKAKIDACKEDGDTLGGLIEVRVEGVPFGLGSHAQWDLKLDGRLAQAVMSIQAIKAVEIGLGVESARRYGSEVHDPIRFEQKETQAATLGYRRPTNHAGGIEAGMTNGQELVIRAAKKPISTLQKPLVSIDMTTKEPSTASYERSDVCAVPAASVIVENVVAFEIAAALIDKFGGDSLQEVRRRWEVFHELARGR